MTLHYQLVHHVQRGQKQRRNRHLTEQAWWHLHRQPQQYLITFLLQAVSSISLLNMFLKDAIFRPVLQTTSLPKGAGILVFVACLSILCIVHSIRTTKEFK